MLKNKRFISIFVSFCMLCGGFLYYAQVSDAEKKPSEDTVLIDQGGFVPHKALYDISLAGTKSGAQIVNIRGQMLYEWQTTCEAWNANHRFNLIYEYADSPALQITSDFSTFEMFDGSSFDFNSQRKRDGDLFEELRGQASAASGDVTGKAVYSKPKGLVFDLPEETLFPMAHTLDVLEHMNAGKKFYSATIFDGSDEKGPVQVTTFIGPTVNAVANIAPSENIDMALLNTSAHNARLAFFPLSEASSTADYEMNLVLHDNGVVSDMFIEYEDFSVSQKLVALERMDTLCTPEEQVTPIDPAQ